MHRTSFDRFRRARSFPPALLFLFTLAVLAVPARAAAPVQLAEPGPFTDVAATGTPDGGSLLVWQDVETEELLARRVSAGGFPGDVLDLGLRLTGIFVNDPVVTFSDSGAWIVLWTQPLGADQVGIGGAVFDADDRLVRRLEFQEPVPQPANAIGENPRVTALPDGGFLFVWTVGELLDPTGDPLSGPLEQNVYAQRLDERGEPVGPAVLVHDATAGAQRASGVGAWNGGVVVTWRSVEEDGDSEILARLFDLGLSPVSGEILVSPPLASEVRPAAGRLVVAADGPFLVAWEQFAEAVSLPVAPTRTVRLRAFDADGAPGGGAVEVDPERRKMAPGLALDGEGVAWVSWLAAAPGDAAGMGPWAVRVRPFDTDGTPRADATGLAMTTDGDAPLLAGRERGALAAWRPSRDAPAVVGETVGVSAAQLPPPAEFALTSPELPGFRVWVRITAGDLASRFGTFVEPCLAEALCAAGALPDRAEVMVRVVGPKPNGFLWPTVVKLSTSRVEVWIEQVATGEVRYYLLPGAPFGAESLPGLFDRDGFEP